VGPKGRSGQVRKILPPPGFDPRTVQPVASRYTDGANPAHPKTIINDKSDGPQSWSGRFKYEKSLFSLPGIERDFWAFQPVDQSP